MGDLRALGGRYPRVNAMVSRGSRRYGRGVRVNFSHLGWMFVVLALVQVLNGDLILAGLCVGMVVAMFVGHRVRDRRFKAYDQTRNFD
jgi:hypothetical protein